MCYVSFFFLLLTSLILLITGTWLGLTDEVWMIEYELLTVNSSEIVMTVLLDWMSLVSMGFVMFISSMVVKYSEGYMEGDINIIRFMIIVVLFVISMMFLIISPNLISILLGWDGLGLVSYCLVIYYQNVKSYNAGMITALSNRIGDVALLMSIAWMLNYGSWNFVFYIEVMSEDFPMFVILFMVILAAMTKSAQIPFSSWLPAAMAAPTPVSALVHSSTLVTAGVYLMIRFNKLLMASWVSNFLLVIAGMTMFMAGVGALFEYDLKKIIALSTLSQLGLMMGILSLGLPLLAFFHLLTHAFFKALLFLCAGSLIHNLKDYQDIRLMGSLVSYMPFTCICFNVSNISLCGFPFLSGFYSKDLILEMVFLGPGNLLIIMLFFVSTLLTAGNSFRLSFYLMLKSYMFSSMVSMFDKNVDMTSGMGTLITLAIMGGKMLSWMIFPVPEQIMLPLSMKLTALVVSIIGAWGGIEASAKKIFELKSGNFKLFVMNFLGGMWFMPILSTKGVVEVPWSAGKSISKFDKSWSESYGGQGLNYVFMTISKKVSVPMAVGMKSYLTLFYFWCLLILMIMIMK
uniref:NADH-ubiquinone oxidoreductase chain 5 n=1 Tax=Xya japonica TaxID=1661859 RepID=A0A7L9QCT0_9ORTH|nr:NADH dehydrogenase subunit 5 [Xya japonica]